MSTARLQATFVSVAVLHNASPETSPPLDDNHSDRKTRPPSRYYESVVVVLSFQPSVSGGGAARFTDEQTNTNKSDRTHRRCFPSSSVLRLLFSDERKLNLDLHDCPGEVAGVRGLAKGQVHLPSGRY